MKKRIKLLVETLFDNDLFNQDTNLMIDVINQIYEYKLGDIYYKNKKPCAICCGLAESFNDNKYRHLYLFNDENTHKVKWETKSHYEIKEPQFHKYDKLVENLEDKIDNDEISLPEDDDYDKNDPNNKLYFGYELNSFNDFMHINENGYNNTQIIKNKYNISEFPIFEECCKLGDNIYLPSIDEL